MTILDIRVFGDPILRQKANEVDTFDERLAKLAADMLETMRDAPGVGLAAPQVGVLKRMFTWEITEPVGEPEEGEEPETETRGGAVVNPVLLDSSEEIQDGDEGCLSFPGLFYPVERPLRLEVRWQDLDGGQRTSTVEGFDARVWLHEMDHLDGILFIDHLARHDKREAMRRMREYRLEHGLDDPDRSVKPGNLLLRHRL